MYQLVYTSAEKGLQPGSSGYCTVGATRQTPELLWNALEGLSTYKHVFPPGDARNIPRFQVVRVEGAGQPWTVASRICDAGFDHSHRSNFLAHHVAWSANTPLRVHAHDLWRLLRGLMSRWEGPPRWLDTPAIGTSQAAISMRAESWHRWASDAGWAGQIADIVERGTPCRLQFSSEAPIDVLLEEVLRLLPPEMVAKATFATGPVDLPARTHCQLRVVGPGRMSAPLPGESQWSLGPRSGPCTSTSPRVQLARLGKATPAPQPRMERGRVATARKANVPAAAAPIAPQGPLPPTVPVNAPTILPGAPSLRLRPTRLRDRERPGLSPILVALLMLFICLIGIGGPIAYRLGLFKELASRFPVERPEPRRPPSDSGRTDKTDDTSADAPSSKFNGDSGSDAKKSEAEEANETGESYKASSPENAVPSSSEEEKRQSRAGAESKPQDQSDPTRRPFEPELVYIPHPQRPLLAKETVADAVLIRPGHYRKNIQSNAIGFSTETKDDITLLPTEILRIPNNLNEDPSGSRVHDTEFALLARQGKVVVYHIAPDSPPPIWITTGQGEPQKIAGEFVVKDRNRLMQSESKFSFIPEPQEVTAISGKLTGSIVFQLLAPKIVTSSDDRTLNVPFEVRIELTYIETSQGSGQRTPLPTPRDAVGELLAHYGKRQSLMSTQFVSRKVAKSPDKPIPPTYKKPWNVFVKEYNRLFKSVQYVAETKPNELESFLSTTHIPNIDSKQTLRELLKNLMQQRADPALATFEIKEDVTVVFDGDVTKRVVSLQIPRATVSFTAMVPNE